jgi:prepilin-type N-terminal cleavage/methylation domain-containing protein
MFLGLRHHRSRRGFTLIEVTLVIVIVLILTTLSIGVYGPFRNKQAAASGMEKVAMALHKARSNAIYEGQRFRVTIEQETQTFWVDRVGATDAEQFAFDLSNQTGTDPITGDPVQIGLPKVVRPEKLPDNVIFSRITNAPSLVQGGRTYWHIVFLPDGSCRSDARIEMVSSPADQALDTSYFTLRVYGPTGVVAKLPQTRLP